MQQDHLFLPNLMSNCWTLIIRPSVVRMCLAAATIAGPVIAADAPARSAQQFRRSRPVRIAPDTGDPAVWLRLHAKPLSGTDPALTLDDLLPLVSELEPANLIGLGDGSHGTREFFRVKHRLIQLFVEKLGFTVVAFEAPWVEFNRIDDWVQGGDGIPEELLHQDDYWFWNTREILDLIWWIREYNLNRGERPAVQVAGVDPVISAPLVADVLAFLRVVDPEFARTAEEAYACLGSLDAPEVRHFSVPEPAEESPCLAAADRITEDLIARRDQYIERSSERRFAQVVQSARMVRQSGEIRSASGIRSSEVRDRLMAENAIWLGNGQKKIVFWAHNLHVGRIPYQFADGPLIRSAGTVLSEQVEDYYVIGMTTRSGQWLASNFPFSRTFTTPAVPALPLDSYENLFATADRSVLYIPLRQPNTPASILRPRPFLVMFANPTFQLTPVVLAELFDAVVFIDQTSSTTLLP